MNLRYQTEIKMTAPSQDLARDLRVGDRGSTAAVSVSVYPGGVQ
jgi:hypothetical protein